MTQSDKEIVEKFREIWAEYPKNQRENTLGLDAVIQQFILDALTSQRESFKKALLLRGAKIRKDALQDLLKLLEDE